jgi:hypothetical protein
LTGSKNSRRVEPVPFVSYLFCFYGQDQGKHGQNEVFRMQSDHPLHQAQQEESKGKAFSQEILQILPEEYPA